MVSVQDCQSRGEGFKSLPGAAQHDQKEEAIFLRSHDEEGKKLPGERGHAGHCTENEKARKTKDAMD